MSSSDMWRCAELALTDVSEERTALSGSHQIEQKFHIHIHIYIHTYTYIHTHLHVHTYTYTYINIHTYTYNTLHYITYNITDSSCLDLLNDTSSDGTIWRAEFWTTVWKGKGIRTRHSVWFLCIFCPGTIWNLSIGPVAAAACLLRDEPQSTFSWEIRKA
jgi:hypothetical protein